MVREDAAILAQQQAIASTRKLTIKLCIQAIQARYKGDNNREDMEIKACVNTLKRLLVA